GNAHDHSRFGQKTAFVDPLDEIPEHLLRDVEVGDHAALQWAHGLDMAPRWADHPLGLVADRDDRPSECVHGDDGGLVQHDPVPPNVDERVRRPQVDNHVLSQEPKNAFGAKAALALWRGKSPLNPFGHGIRALFYRRSPEVATQARDATPRRGAVTPELGVGSQVPMIIARAGEAARWR